MSRSGNCRGTKTCPFPRTSPRGRREWILNAPGTIDADYRGEVKVILVNHGTAPFAVTRGMRVAQLLVAPVDRVAWEEVPDLPPTSRGPGGFGHTGR